MMESSVGLAASRGRGAGAVFGGLAGWSATETPSEFAGWVKPVIRAKGE